MSKDTSNFHLFQGHYYCCHAAEFYPEMSGCSGDSMRWLVTLYREKDQKVIMYWRK